MDPSQVTEALAAILAAVGIIVGMGMTFYKGYKQGKCIPLVHFLYKLFLKYLSSALQGQVAALSFSFLAFCLLCPVPAFRSALCAMLKVDTVR